MEFGILLMKYYFIVKTFLILIPIIFFSAIIYNFFALSGYFFAEHDFSQENPFVKSLYPALRLEDTEKDVSGRFFQKIIADPVYFDVKTPLHFQKAKVTVEFQKENQNIIELGGTVDYNARNYILKPLDNEVVNQLFLDKNWNQKNDDGIILFQKKSAKQFFSAEDALSNLDDYSKLALYNFPSNRKFTIPNYQPSEKYLEINKSMRGYHELYTFVKDEALDFTFLFQDINRHIGEDPVDIFVYFNNEPIKQFNLPDDGYKTEYDPSTLARELKVYIPDLAEGVYKIVINTNDDVFIRKIKTKQQYLTFINNLYLTDNKEYKHSFPDLVLEPTIVYTNGDKIYAQTTHVNGFQDLAIGDQTMSIAETHKQYFLEDLGEIKSRINERLVPIIAPVNDVKISTNALFSFSKEAFFDPNFINLKGRTKFDFDSEGIDYVIAKYQPPKNEEGWFSAQQTFDLENFYYFNGNTLRFVISVPDIEQSKGFVKISKIKVELFRQPFTFFDLGKIFQKIISGVKDLLWT